MSTIKLSTKLEFDRVSFEKEHEMHLLINLEGAKSNPQNRKPMTLSAVIDVSGSMAGKKIEYARKTLKKLIQSMSSEDRLGIIAYSTTVETVFAVDKMTAENKEKALSEVDRLVERDSTNLSGGMLEGFGMLKDKEGDIVRVFLMTDGLPNTGVSDHAGLVNLVAQRPKGVSLSCFGYGSDYNPELLGSMAKEGGGNLHYIKNPDDCMGAFGRELGGLISCVAQGIKVKIKTKPDFKILEVLSDFDVDGNKDQTEATISVDDVYSEERRRVLLKIQIPKTDKALPRPIKFADIEVEYHDLVGGGVVKDSTSVEIEQVKPEDAQKEQSVEVKEELGRIAAAKAQEEAIKLANAGNFVAAQGVIQQAALFCSTIGTKVGDEYANDLKNNVVNMVRPDMYAVGGRQQLSSHAGSYMSARSSSVQADSLFSTAAVKGYQDEFAGPVEAEPVKPFIHNGPIPLQPGASTLQQPVKFEDKKKPVSKKRKKRE